MNEQLRIIFVSEKQASGISGNIPESSLLTKYENNGKARHLLFLAEYSFLQQQVFLKSCKIFEKTNGHFARASYRAGRDGHIFPSGVLS